MLKLYKMKIGLTYTGDHTKHQNYVNWLKGKDDIEIIKLSAEDKNHDAIKDCDALVLSGGIDIDPQISGGQKDYRNKPEKWQPERDLFEKSLYEYALDHDMPVLGICRGLQLVNVLQGGSLIDDLGDLNEKHKKEGAADREHVIKIKENTLLNEIVKTTAGEVNSAHHQSVDKLGKELIINSQADDGTIEGIEWKDKTGKPFMLCVQWHPERMFQFPNSPLSSNIRNRFIEAIINSRTEKYENN